MKTFKIDPRIRGLEEDELKELGLLENAKSSNIKFNNIKEETPYHPRLSSLDLNIVKIISYGRGWIIVQMSNGRKFRRSSGTIAWRYNNPGNLKFGPFARSKGSIGAGDGGHSVFPNVEIGKNAMKELLFSSERGYDVMSINNALKKYAPVSDGNDPNSYSIYVEKQTGINRHRILKSLNNREQDLVLNAMIRMEGWKEGKIEEV